MRVSATILDWTESSPHDPSPATPTTTTREQERWNEIVDDPQLRDLPCNVETNAQGQILLTPYTTRHSRQRKAVKQNLDTFLPGGEAFQEWPVVTEDGTRQADVI